MAGEGARMSEKEAIRISRRRIRPLMLLGKFGGISEIESRIGGGRMDTYVRKGGGADQPPLNSAANVVRKVRGV